MQTCPGFFLKSLLESPGNLFGYICRHLNAASSNIVLFGLAPLLPILGRGVVCVRLVLTVRPWRLLSASWDGLRHTSYPVSRHLEVNTPGDCRAVSWRPVTVRCCLIQTQTLWVRLSSCLTLQSLVDLMCPSIPRTLLPVSSKWASSI